MGGPGFWVVGTNQEAWPRETPLSRGGGGTPRTPKGTDYSKCSGKESARKRCSWHVPECLPFQTKVIQFRRSSCCCCRTFIGHGLSVWPLLWCIVSARKPLREPNGTCITGPSRKDEASSHVLGALFLSWSQTTVHFHPQPLVVPLAPNRAAGGHQ